MQDIIKIVIYILNIYIYHHLKSGVVERNHQRKIKKSALDLELSAVSRLVVTLGK